MLLFDILLLLTNAILGFVMTRQSSAAIEKLVRQNMQEISCTAAALLDGGMLGKLTEEDVGTPEYDRLLGDLRAFQDNAEIEYIYAVRQVGEDSFVFLLDADPEDPADFGEEVLVTDALRKAARGVAAVDDAPAQDEWGCFYSAYCPVYETHGEIAGIVGVDFDSVWFDEQLSAHSTSLATITIIFVVSGGIIVMLFTRRVLKRLGWLDVELSALSSDVDELEKEILSNTGGQIDGESTAAAVGAVTTEAGGDEIEVLGSKVRYLQAEIRTFLDYSRKMAYTDALTGVGNTTAYVEAQKRITEQIGEGSAAFCVVLFDINDLKRVNDGFGHAAGDRIIRGTAEAIEYSFGREGTFRIGGDEFLVIAEGVPEEEIPEKLRRMTSWIEDFNCGNEEDHTNLSVSTGAAAFRPEQDTTFREVFVRADESMYREKREFHRNNDRRVNRLIPGSVK